MVLGHVGLELLGVGTRWGLPAGFFGGAVEVVWEVFRVGVADFPGGGEAGVGLVGSGQLTMGNRAAEKLVVEYSVLTMIDEVI